MRLDKEQRAHVGRMAASRGWVCQQCGATLVSTGYAFRVVGGYAYFVGLRCANDGATHPEGQSREDITERITEDDAEDLGIDY